MGTYYTDSNKENSRALWYKKNIYQSEVLKYNKKLDVKHIIDFNNGGEKILYGKTNSFFIPVEIKNQKSLKAFASQYWADNTRPMKAMNFVVDVFEQMAKQFMKCAQLNQIATNDPFLTNLKIYKAYEDPRLRYNNYFDILTTSIKNQIRSTDHEIVNFESYASALLETIANSSHVYPFTKPAYLKSRLCPRNCSGFVIEIADLNYANDELKINQFINGPNWEFYVNTCNSYGFMIDANAPWRLVADIDSLIMRETGRAYGVSSPAEVLSKKFITSHTSYFERFQADLFASYNITRKKQIIKPVVCSAGTSYYAFDGYKTIPSITPVHEYSWEEFKNIYSTEYFLRKYFEIRFLEEESPFTYAQREQLIHEALCFYRGSGLVKTLDGFERILNKTFDYYGSFSYYIRQYLAGAYTIDVTVEDLNRG